MCDTWKRQFPQEFRAYVAQLKGVAPGSDKEAYSVYLEMSMHERRGIWLFVSERLSIRQKQVHDYFHNTWIKQFYDNITGLRKPLLEQLEQNYAETCQNVQMSIHLTIQWLKQTHQQLRLHLQSTYSYLYNLLTRAHDSKPKKDADEQASLLLAALSLIKLE